MNHNAKHERSHFLGRHKLQMLLFDRQKLQFMVHFRREANWFLIQIQWNPGLTIFGITISPV